MTYRSEGDRSTDKKVSMPCGNDGQRQAGKRWHEFWDYWRGLEFVGGGYDTSIADQFSSMPAGVL